MRLMAKNVKLQKKISGTLQDINPRTIASMVYMSDGVTTLQNYLEDLEDKLNMDQVYMTGSNNEYLVDSDNTKLVAVY